MGAIINSRDRDMVHDRIIGGRGADALAAWGPEIPHGSPVFKDSSL